MSIGKLTRVALREVWKHEALDFTVWLQDNLDILNEVLDFNLTSAEREKSAGSFNVDLVGEDESGRVVIIENQLEKSDHKHLGQVLTYVALLDAAAAIWIVKEGRPEHVKAVNWLIENTDTPFYIIQLEAVRIGDSPAAPLFTKIVGPSIESRAAGVVKKDLSDRHKYRHQFWTALLAHAKTKTQLHANITPGKYSWVGTSAGKRGLGWNYDVRQNEVQATLYIDTGDKALNTKYYEQLTKDRKAIDEAFGTGLEWQDMEGKRGYRIRKVVNTGGYRDVDKYDATIEAVVQDMMKLVKALGPYVKKLKG